MRDLDAKQRADIARAKGAEVASWLKYLAVEAALRANYDPAEVMRLRWVLSFKADGRAKARLVVVGYQDPRIGSEVKTAAPVISRRGRQLFFVASAHYGFGCCKGDVSGAFLQGDLLNGRRNQRV